MFTLMRTLIFVLLYHKTRHKLGFSVYGNYILLSERNYYYAAYNKN
jgi:hypothetical protein